MARRILVTGSRDWTDRATVQAALRAAGMGERCILVSGACPTGADRMAEEEAALLGWDIELHPADWEAHGKRAGFLRNRTMVLAGAEVVLAFIKNNSRGATMTVDLARAAGLRVVEYRDNA